MISIKNMVSNCCLLSKRPLRDFSFFHPIRFITLTTPIEILTRKHSLAAFVLSKILCVACQASDRPIDAFSQNRSSLKFHKIRKFWLAAEKEKKINHRNSLNARRMLNPFCKWQMLEGERNREWRAKRLRWLNGMQDQRQLFLKMGHSRPLFLYFRLFNTVDSK